MMARRRRPTAQYQAIQALKIARQERETRNAAFYAEAEAKRVGLDPTRFQPVTNGNYESIQDFVDAATNELVCDANKHHVADCLTHSQRWWYGAECDTGKDVVKKLHDGWPEGQKKLEALTAQLIEVQVHPKDRRRRRVRRDFGDSVDIHAIYRGNLDTAWEIAKRQEGCGPQHVDIFANMLCAGGDQADVLFWRGAAAIVLAEKLEAAGYMVRIVVGFGGKNGNYDKTSCRITVKAHDKPLDITSTASVIMPGFFRAIGHCWLASHARAPLDGYGISVDQGKIEEGELVLSHDVKNEGSARKWLERTVTDFNDGAMVI